MAASVVAACGREPAALPLPECEPVLMVSPPTITIAVGQRARARGTMSGCLTDRRMTWRSLDSSVAGVVESHDSADVYIASVLGRGVGPATVLMTSVQDPTRSAWAAVTVLPVAVANRSVGGVRSRAP